MRLRELLEAHYDYRNFNLGLDFKPLKKGDTITLFHGFSNHSDAIETAKHGLSGGEKVTRVYSYEQDNNPKGLFVTPSFKTAASFIGTYKLSVIIEFDADLSELEAPVWPGGSWTGYGGYAEYFGRGKVGKYKRHQKKKEMGQDVNKDKYVPDYVKLSDDIYLANMLLNKGEPQALYVGHLNPNRIKAFHVKEQKSDYSHTEWMALSKDEFLHKYETAQDEKHKSKSKVTDKLFQVDELFNGEEFKKRLQQKYPNNDINRTLSNLWNNVKKSENKAETFTDSFIPRFLWPKQISDAFRWFHTQFK